MVICPMGYTRIPAIEQTKLGSGIVRRYLTVLMYYHPVHPYKDA